MNRLAQLIVIISILFSFHSCMEEPNMQPNTTEGNFNALWNIIDKQYCYLDYKNINWEEIYETYHPRLKSVENQYQLFDLFSEMLNELQDGHVNLYSNFDKSRYSKWFTDYPSNFDSKLIFNERYLGKNYRIAGNLLYSTIADEQIGYIYNGSFSKSFSDKNINAIFDQFSSCKGLIIDVRNNGGGMLSYSEKLASYFFSEKTLTGYIIHKTGDGHSDFSIPKPIYTNKHKSITYVRPVVILTNRSSYSAANDFICRLQYAPNATIIGDISGGGGGLPMSSELPNGWMVRFSASPILDANNKHIEWGIEPDIRVDILEEDKQKGFDTIIETAINYISIL